MGREETKQIIAGYEAASILPASETYTNYAMTAELLYDTPQVLDIKSKLASFYQDFKEAPPVFTTACKFFALCAPSGSGKTQLGFSLGKHADLKVVHLCLTPCNGSAHSTGRLARIGALSRLARSAVELDYLDWKAANSTAEGTVLSWYLIGSWPQVALRTVALLAEVLGMSGSGRVIATTEELRDAITASAEAGERLPVLLIDEAFAHEASAPAVTFLKTVATVSAIATILTGTSTNMILSAEPWIPCNIAYTASPPPALVRAANRPSRLPPRGTL
jgi:hypothetical protein